jgi:hypothetical protein
MALSPFQRDVCRLLAQTRETGNAQSYVAGGAALNETLDAPRLSRDVDLFHDTLEALDFTWQADRGVLREAGYEITIVRERTGFVEAEIARDGQSVLMQWARDSAWRFFPLQAHPDLGWTLHPFDLATNKVLALVGRIETRDWVDALTCHNRVAPLGLLAWAACGKDEGWNPQLILEEAARNARTSREEWEQIEWQGAPPDLFEMKTRWREALQEAREIITLLPPETVGQAVLDENGELFRGGLAALRLAMTQNALCYRSGHIRGVWPQSV